MEPMQWLMPVVFALTIAVVITNVIDSTLAALVGIWIIAVYFGKTGHRIDSGSPARRQTWYCRRDLCPNG